MYTRWLHLLVEYGLLVMYTSSTSRTFYSSFKNILELSVARGVKRENEQLAEWKVREDERARYF